MTKFEKSFLYFYLKNLISDTRLDQKVARKVHSFIKNLLGLDHSDDNFITCEASCTPLLQELSSAWSLDDQEDVEKSYLKNNISLLAEKTDLSREDQAIFTLVVLHETDEKTNKLCNDLSEAELPPIQIISMFLGISNHTVSACLSSGKPLLSSGLILSVPSNSGKLTERYQLSALLLHALLMTRDNSDDIFTHLLGAPSSTELNWEDFDFLGNTHKQIAIFLDNATKQQLPGINILLWGAPGTGKTEFCKTLANRIGCKLYSVCEADIDGNEPNRRERQEQLKLSQGILRYQKNSLLLFDEMEDLLPNSSSAGLFELRIMGSSKVFLNRLFESNPVPTIWVINDIDKLDESIIRRMSFVLEFASPSTVLRERMVRKICSRHNCELTSEMADALISYEIPAAVIDSSARFSQVLGQGPEDILFAAKSFSKALNRSTHTPNRQSVADFHPELINPDMDLIRLASQLQSAEETDFSLCLYGPSGTGKSAYVYYLAKKLGMDILVKKGSDVLGKYVGETETNIAQAFEEARTSGRFLLFDEADSLLSDRTRAERRWEVSQVNEMLTWMESHPLPFACTTNLKGHIDTAAMRRFTFKCKFNFLRADQIRTAFSHFFDFTLDERQINEMQSLTPGDFSVVQKKLRFIGHGSNNQDLIDLVKQEISAKGNSPKKTLGFALN